MGPRRGDWRACAVWSLCRIAKPRCAPAQGAGLLTAEPCSLRRFGLCRENELEKPREDWRNPGSGAPYAAACDGTSVAGADYLRATRRNSMARKYSKKASKKVGRAMRERKRGTLRSGRSGRKVKSRKQAIAIGLSEARREGAKVPKKKTA